MLLLLAGCCLRLPGFLDVIISGDGRVCLSSSDELSSGEWCADRVGRVFDARFLRGEVVVDTLAELDEAFAALVSVLDSFADDVVVVG